MLPYAAHLHMEHGTQINAVESYPPQRPFPQRDSTDTLGAAELIPHQVDIPSEYVSMVLYTLVPVMGGIGNPSAN